MASRLERPAWFVALAAALTLSRWLPAPRYLITFDDINFALAIQNFNPMLHQPQPPGYPLFVGLLKLLSRLLAGRTEMAFLAAGLAMSFAALLLLWRLGESITGRRRGILCALLLLFNPAFWLAAFTNPVRLCGAAGSAAVALCVWRACHEDARRWLPIAAGALGLFAGFRPDIVVALAPLLVWATFRTRAGLRTAALECLCCGAAVATWLPFLIAAVGGWRQFWIVLRGYSDAQFTPTSLLFGAPPAAALHMACEALVWSCLGALSWLWIVPVLLRRSGVRPKAWPWRFLLWWFVPGFLFYALVHVGDPDHTLTVIPATCAAGALAISTLTRRTSLPKTIAVGAFCVLLNVFLFLKPISTIAKVSTIVPVRWVDGYIVNMIDGLHRLEGHGPLTVVFDDWNCAWRQLAYYAPRAHVVVIEREGGRVTGARHIVGIRAAVKTGGQERVGLPGCGTLVWVDPVTRPKAIGGTALEAYHGVVYSTAAAARGTVDFSGVRFVAGEESCAGNEP